MIQLVFRIPENFIYSSNINRVEYKTIKKVNKNMKLECGPL